jgi:hypothetical protein
MLEGLGQLKHLLTSLENKHATIRLVKIQLLHR